MKNRTTKIAIAGILVGSLFLGGSIHAMNDNDLTKYILEQIKIEEKLSDDQVKEVEKDLEKISRKDILEELKEEISYVEDETLKKKLSGEISELEKLNDPKMFFDVLDRIYEQLDELYEDYEGEEGEGEYFSFEDEKKEILDSLKEELQYAEKDEIKKQIETSLKIIAPITDEDTFFDTLDSEYEKVDALYEKYFSDEDFEDFDEFEDGEEYNFEDTKKEVLESLKEEIAEIKDTKLKTKLQKYSDTLTLITDEDKFFNELDKIYSDEELEAYYEANGIDILDDEDIEDFDFDTERKEIIKELKLEIAELPEGDLKKEITVKVGALESETKEANFFDKLDDIYDQLDSFYGYDEEDWYDEEDEEEYDSDEHGEY